MEAEACDVPGDVALGAAIRGCTCKSVSSVSHRWDTGLRASGAEADERRMLSVVLVFFILVLIVRPILRESFRLQSR